MAAVDSDVMSTIAWKKVGMELRIEARPTVELMMLGPRFVHVLGESPLAAASRGSEAALKSANDLFREVITS